MYSLSFSRLRGIVNTLTLSLTALCAAAPAVVAAQGTPVRGGTLIAVVQPEPQVLTSAINTGNPTGVVSVNIFDGLLSYDEKLAPQPALAQSWQISQDGKSITFHLRHGVKWHDGAPFTSADVRFSALEIWKKVHPRGRVTFAELRDVETPDAYTAVFRLDHPSPAIMSALNAMEGQILPEHIYGGTDIAKTALSKPPIGTGPFRFKEWKKGQYIELERNPDYWDSGKPYIDKLIFRIIPDAATRSAAFETGDVQYGAYSIVPLSDVARLTKLPTIGIQTHGYEWGAPFLTLEFNLRHAPLNQLKVRQAIAQAVDKRGLIDTVWYGFGKPATGPVPSPLKNFYTADVQHYDYNVAQAEKLLDAAGYPRKADGVRFNLSIDYMAYGDVYRDSAEY
ncbi:MAG: ABC transporter substrate-binding protein, partial [Janthinobacterium lividum]